RGVAAWLCAPLVAFLVSQPLPRVAKPLSDAERRSLRLVARRTWGFFETFVGDADHWLPPDNYQEDPKGQVAHRTSPTNIGLLLLSTLAAHDFGHLSARALARRLAATFATLGKLERYRGHFLNWFETLTLRPLNPSYVSTVDSGNLLSCLTVLEHGLDETLAQPWPSPAQIEGLGDTLGLAAIEAGRTRLRDEGDAATWRSVGDAIEALKRGLADVTASELLAYDDGLSKLEQQATALLNRVGQTAEKLDPHPRE